MANNESASTTPRYDVFISCKSEDYKYAEEIYDFLKSQGIKSFLASKELRRLGESEYLKAISAAMKSAQHIIVFASKAEYIDSEWVYFEWDMFLNAKLKGFKSGNIITILKDVQTDDINIVLWKFESMTFENYKDTLVQYVETEESRSRAEEIKKRNESEAEQRRREEEERRLLTKKKEELLAVAKEWHDTSVKLMADEARLKGLMKQLHITSRQCPVCGAAVPLDKRFCALCGWSISPLAGIEGAEHLITVDEEQVAISNEVSELKKKFDEYSQEIIKLKEANAQLAEKLKASANLIPQDSGATIRVFYIKATPWFVFSLSSISKKFASIASELGQIINKKVNLPCDIMTPYTHDVADMLVKDLAKIGIVAEIV